MAITTPSQSERRRRRRRLTDISIATRLSLVALTVTLVSLAITAGVGLRRGGQLADDMAETRLATIASSRGAAVETYVRSVRLELTGLAASPVTADSIGRLAASFRELADDPPSSGDTLRLTEYYLAEIVPGLEAMRGEGSGTSFLVPEQPAAVALQLAYTIPIARADGTSIDPALVDDAGDGSAYSAVHASVHPVYASIAARSGFDDLFLIDAATETIVYSVRKRIDFATSLDVGPLSGSSLATVVAAVADGAARGSNAIADAAPYPATADEPRMFITSAVVDPAGDVVGYVAGAIATDRLDRIMSGGGSWRGFGEAYLAGADATMRSTALSFVEAPTAFLDAATDGPIPSLNADQRRRIAATGTTAVVQPVDRDLLTLAGLGPGVTSVRNHSGTPVVAAYRPVAIDGLDWTVVAQVAVDELNDPIEAYARNMLLTIALIVVAVAFFAVRWADRQMAPVRTIAAHLRAVRGGSHAGDVTVLRVAPDSPQEYLDLADDIDGMLTRLAGRETELVARADERTRLVGRFLPFAAARRSEDGTTDGIEQAREATVVVLVVDGIGDLVERGNEQFVRNLLAALVDEIDALAADFGVERVKSSGDRYYAVCGVTRPYLDHAARSVAFALAARELVNELANEHAVDLGVRGGVDSGAMAVGVTGRDALVYDAWGPAMEGAAQLARRAPARSIAVTNAVSQKLPDEFVTIGADVVQGAAIVTGRLTEGAP